jgi:nitronate monooxygenase
MTNLFAKLGIPLPIVQAPMAGVSTPELAAAVTDAGALGSIAIGAVDVAGARKMIEAVRRLTRGPFNVNVFCHAPAKHNAARETAWLNALRPVFHRFGAEPPATLSEIYTSFIADPAMQNLLVETRPAVVSFHFGLPAQPVIGRLKSAGILTFATATNPDEAARAEAAGIDVLVAQGYEAGGHRGVFDPSAPDAKLGTLALTRLLVAKTNLPVIAAGGIMDGAGIAAVLGLGAVAAQLGTAFVACPESSADAAHRTNLMSPSASSTVMTPVFSGRPARGLPNAMTTLDLGAHTPPDYPIAYDANKALAAAARAKGEFGFGAQWAGQGAPLARSLPAAELIAALKAELGFSLSARQ